MNLETKKILTIRARKFLPAALALALGYAVIAANPNESNSQVQIPSTRDCEFPFLGARKALAGQPEILGASLTQSIDGFTEYRAITEDRGRQVFLDDYCDPGRGFTVNVILSDSATQSARVYEVIEDYNGLRAKIKMEAGEDGRTGYNLEIETKGKNGFVQTLRGVLSNFKFGRSNRIIVTGNDGYLNAIYSEETRTQPQPIR